MSYILYAHPEIGGTPDWYKVGKAITPYSAQRLRQRNMLKTFEIPHLWFGYPEDISRLESAVHDRFPGPEILRGNGELINSPIKDLLRYINGYIKRNDLQVVELKMKTPYTAHCSNKCPFGFPVEKNIHTWAEVELAKAFNTTTTRKRTLAQRNRFEMLFSV